MKKSLISSLLHIFIAAVLIVIPAHQSSAAPGTLPSSPLYLSSIVEPNVFLTLDDSRSMTFNTLVSQDTGKLRGATFNVIPENIPNILLNTPIGSGWMSLLYMYDVPANNDLYVVPPRSVAPEAWVFKSPQANKLYYNPNVSYIPWPGTDAAGNPLYDDYTDPAVGVNNVALYPENPASPTVDITLNHSYGTFFGFKDKFIYLPTYYIWDESSDANKVIDADTDTYQEFIITDSAQLGNFANWFAYYRSRQSTMKSSMGRIVNNTDSRRMGLRLFNQGHRFNAATMTDSTNKLSLLNELYASNGLGVASGSISPARTALESTGVMFANELPGVPSPIVPEADGGTCQQNFNIMMTDGYWNGPEPTNWGTKKPKDTLNTDADSTISVSEFDGDLNQSNDGGNYADSHSGTLADVAMHFYETDLRADLLDKVPTRTGLDEAAHQHLVNYILSFGMEGTLDTTVDPADPNPAIPFVWPEPVPGTPTTIDDLWHASYNSRGDYLAVDGTSIDLDTKLHLSFSNVTERTGTAAAVAVNSARLSTESVIYLARFNTLDWQGSLFAFPIKDTATGELVPKEKWEASKELDNKINTLNGDGSGWKDRIIVTYHRDTKSGVPFQWDKIKTSTVMAADLNMSPNGIPDSLGLERLNYLRGDRSNEASGLFRGRLSALGDLVNSGPVFVGPPNLAWRDLPPFPTGLDAYSEFKSQNVDRQGMIYVGANDGMLHAFNDDNGDEVFAFIPGTVYSSETNKGLHYLTNPNYIHNFYVDLTPTLSDVFISSGASKKWHTVLVGGLRSGGKGIYALDVTDPTLSGFTHAEKEADAAKRVLWEFTSDNDSGLGFTYSRPVIGMTNAGTWVAVFGNGYESTTGEASLFIVDIEKGTDGAWDIGDYQKISTGVGTVGDKNGLAPPALADIDGNGTIDRAYAGDLRGNMWVFDLTSTSPGGWTIANKSGGTSAPLFTTATKQPITAKPVLASHPTVPDSSQNSPNIMVYFGSGQYLVNGDKVTTDTQAFHGVWDMGKAQLTQSDLVQQQFDANYTQGRVLTRNPVDYSLAQGCFFNLPDSGERSVTPPIARADTVFFNTFVPDNKACSIGGYGYRFAVDMSTCGSPLLATIDSNGDSVVDDNDYVSNGVTDSTLAAVRQEGYLPEPVFIEDLAFTGEQATKIKALSNVPTGRFSWQELLF